LLSMLFFVVVVRHHQKAKGSMGAFPSEQKWLKERRKNSCGPLAARHYT